MPVRHIIDVLADAGVLDDDRPDTLALWLDEQLAGFPRRYGPSWTPGSGCGARRAPPQAPRRQTIVRDIPSIRTFLAGADGRYSTLRQVTREDITTWLAGRPAVPPQDASTLRSLFGTLKAERLIFANPARGIRVSRRNPSVPAPLPGAPVTAPPSRADDPALRSWSRWPRARAPARPDPQPAPGPGRPGRPPTRSRRANRPLDEFTAAAISGYLTFRSQRWPATTSPYLLVTRKTAHTGETVSQFWMDRLFRGLPVTASQLRDDRIVEEALDGRADPLHLAGVFGFDPRTGLRYAQAARQTPELAGTHHSRRPDP